MFAICQESYKDAAGTVMPHMNQLKAEPVYDLPETTPCAVAAAVSGTRGEIGGPLCNRIAEEKFSEDNVVSK